MVNRFSDTVCSEPSSLFSPQCQTAWLKMNLNKESIFGVNPITRWRSFAFSSYVFAPSAPPVMEGSCTLIGVVVVNLLKSSCNAKLRSRMNGVWLSWASYPLKVSWPGSPTSASLTSRLIGDCWEGDCWEPSKQVRSASGTV